MVYRMVFSVDGGCRGNGQPDAVAAAACCLRNRYAHFRPRSRVRDLTCEPDNPAPTSQRAELTAMIMALEWVLERNKKLRTAPRLRIVINSDSRFVIDCMTKWMPGWIKKGWRKADGSVVRNLDLMQQASHLDDLVRALGSVKYVWIPREENKQADALCQKRLAAKLKL